jgi:ribonucleotide reductase beta subunit family protein with ferritin-like domain
MYTTDPVLKSLQDKLRLRSFSLRPKECPKEFAKLLATNVILEGLLFYVNFYTFYKLGRDTNAFNGTIATIRYINKDEDVHNNLVFVPMFHEHLYEHHLTPEDVKQDVFELFEAATHDELLWAESLDPSNNELRDFVKHRAALCLTMLGYEDNPFSAFKETYPAWFYNEDEGGVKLSRQDSFFQSTVTNYERYTPNLHDVQAVIDRFKTNTP